MCENSHGGIASKGQLVFTSNMFTCVLFLASVGHALPPLSYGLSEVGFGRIAWITAKRAWKIKVRRGYP